MSEWIVSDEDLGCDGAYFNYQEIVRCKDCKLFQPFKGARAKVNTDKSGWCGINDYSVRADDYCSYGERRNG